MADKKTIAVVGATGAQGGGLARAILDDPHGEFACRALTRDTTSEAARALADRGAEVVPADLDDEDSLAAAFEGAHGAYCMTNFFEHFSAEKETAQAGNLARAAKTTRIRHAIWSTSQDSQEWVSPTGDSLPASPDGYLVPHWDGKAQGNHFFTDVGVPTTFLLPPMFWENLFMPGAPHQVQRGVDGVLAISLPAADARIPGMAAEDIGRCAYGIFQAGGQFVGATVGVASEILTATELATALSPALSEEVRYNRLSLEAVRAAPYPGADAVANMFQIITEMNGEYCAQYEPDLSRSLNPRLQTLAGWLAGSRPAVPAPAGAR